MLRESSGGPSAGPFVNRELRRVGRMTTVAIALTGLLLFGAFLMTQPIISVAVAVGVGGLLWLCDRLYARPCVYLANDHIEVVNPFRSHRVSWGSITDVRAGRYLYLDVANVGTITVWSVQNPNLDLIMDRDGYADEVATLIKARLDHPDPMETPLGDAAPTRLRRPDRRLAGVVFAACIVLALVVRAIVS